LKKISSRTRVVMTDRPTRLSCGAPRDNTPTATAPVRSCSPASGAPPDEIGDVLRSLAESLSQRSAGESGSQGSLRLYDAEKAAMKTMTVEDDLYGALEAAADLNGRSVEELHHEAIASWLADAAMDDADRSAIARARAEATEQGGVESEAFFEELLGDRD